MCVKYYFHAHYTHTHTPASEKYFLKITLKYTIYVFTLKHMRSRNFFLYDIILESLRY